MNFVWFWETERPGSRLGDPLSYAGISPSDLLSDSSELIILHQMGCQLLDESGKIPFHEIKEQDLAALFAFMQSGEDSLINEDDGQPFVDA